MVVGSQWVFPRSRVVRETARAARGQCRQPMTPQKRLQPPRRAASHLFDQICYMSAVLHRHFANLATLPFGYSREGLIRS